MSENTERNPYIEDIDFPLYKYGLIDRQNINKYFVSEKKNSNQRFKSNALIIFLILNLIKISLNSIAFNNEYYPIFYFDLIKLVGLAQYFYAICLLVIILCLRIVYLFNYSDCKLYKWLKIIEVLKGLKSMDTIGIQDQNKMKNFVQKVSFYKFLISIGAKLDTFLIIVMCSYLVLISYKNFEGILYGIINVFLVCSWATYVHIVLLYSFLYYFITCYYCGLTFKLFNQMISEKKIFFGFEFIQKSLQEHNYICNNTIQYLFANLWVSISQSIQKHCEVVFP